MDHSSDGSFRRTRGRRVLIVDDNTDAAEMLADLMRTAGHEVRVAHDGRQAMALLDNFVPEVAVLDIGLPVMDGYELAGRMRRRLANTPVRLIALTGYGQRRDRERSRAAGFSRHFVKPVNTTLLLEDILLPPG